MTAEYARLAPYSPLLRSKLAFLGFVKRVWHRESDRRTRLSAATAVLMACGIACTGVGKVQANVGDGNWALELCEMEGGGCLAFVVGLLRGQSYADHSNELAGNRRLKLFCTPANVTVKQVVDIFRNVLVNRPETRHLPSEYLFFIAMEENFPCP